jgi:hypothetical protein
MKQRVNEQLKKTDLIDIMALYDMTLETYALVMTSQHSDALKMMDGSRCIPG